MNDAGQPAETSRPPSRDPAGPDDGLAADLRGLGPVGVLAIVVVLGVSALWTPIGALLVLAWAWRSRTPWRAIGYVRERRWVGTALLGIVAGVAFKLVMKAIVMPMLGADPINPAYHYLVGNAAAIPGILFEVTVGAGFAEETVYRGFLFERLGRWWGRSRAATVAIVVLTSAYFAALHLPGQGIAGMEQAAVTGLVFGAIFARTGRIWPLMWAHAAFDVAAVAIIYANLETKIAHLVFR